MATTEVETHELALEDDDGRAYIGRITGRRLAYDDSNNIEVFQTDDERIILYDTDRLRWSSVEYMGDLANELTVGAYVDAMVALGEKAVVDL